MSKPDPSLRKVNKKEFSSIGRELAEILAVTNEHGYGSSIRPGWSIKFLVVLTFSTGGSSKKFSSNGYEMVEILEVINKTGYRSS